MRELTAHLGERTVGTLSEGEGLWAFTYDPSWAGAPDSFDLAPGLNRAQLRHEDGGTHRPVQWYFDNLLPEEKLREIVSKEAGLKGDDAFALLQYLGAESTGSLILLPPGDAVPTGGDFQHLPDETLSKRIRNLPRYSLSHGAPKRMSVAGAQNKLLVVYRDDVLYEPVGAEPSTHILKPDHTSDDYPASVFNEYLVMRLAGRVGLATPAVYRRFVPEPVYIVERFDRYADSNGRMQRLHMIDACQLLGKSRTFKNSAATVETLNRCIQACRNRAGARLALVRWLIFNTLIGNDDNHLKNISFLVGPQGIDIAPTYDLLSTCVYHTKVFADDRAIWPEVPMMIPLPRATRFGEVTRASILESAQILGLPNRTTEREIDRMASALPRALDELAEEIQGEHRPHVDSNAAQRAQEHRLFSALKHVVIAEMIARVV